jgi:hypothetical protein
MERTLCQGVELSTWGALGVASLYRIAGAACVVSRFCGMPHGTSIYPGICNPHGYPRESAGFDLERFVEV